jgi:hypothetical protein
VSVPRAEIGGAAAGGAGGRRVACREPNRPLRGRRLPCRAVRRSPCSPSPPASPPRRSAHYGGVEAIRKLAADLKPEGKERLRVVSFGDEIGLGRADFNDPKARARFRAWLKEVTPPPVP